MADNGDRGNPADHLRAHRWAKGQSGNPGGRARGTSIRSILRKVLAQKHGSRSYYELLGELIYREAMKGKAPFVRELLDRVEGRVQDREQPGEPRYSKLVFNLVEATRPPDHSPPALPVDEGRVNARPVPPR